MGIIFERRVYELRPGAAGAFWDLQRAWNAPAQYRCVLECNVGYFETRYRDRDTITHLYRYDSLDDWDRRLQQSYSPARAPYLATARKLVMRQENGFYAPAPSLTLSPVWGAGQDWRPGAPLIAGVADPESGVLVEEILDFRPGGVAPYLDQRESAQAPGGSDAAGALIGLFTSKVGILHRVLEYRWFDDPDAAARHAGASWPPSGAAAGPLRDVLNGRQINALTPSPVSWMRPLFESIDWSLDGERTTTSGGSHG